MLFTKFSIRNISLSLSIALMTVVGGGHAVSRPITTEFEKLPTHLHKGVNFSYVYGNTDWMYLRNLNPAAQDNQRPIKFISIPEAQAIVDAGFDHIRIPIDPVSFGADPVTGELNYFYTPADNSPDPVALMTQLQETIAACNKRGLAVILDCHPVAINKLSLKIYYMSTGLSEANAIIAANSWARIERQSWVTGTPDKYHPLRVFWTWFSQYFAMSDPDMVFFEVMNEQLMDFEPAFFGYTTQTGPIWQYPNGIEAFKLWMNQRVSEWRPICWNAVKGIAKSAPDHKIIVQPYKQFPEDLTLVEDDICAISKFAPGFGNVDVTSTFASNLIYAVHVYEPWGVFINNPNASYDPADHFVGTVTAVGNIPAGRTLTDPLQRSTKGSIDAVTAWRLSQGIASVPAGQEEKYPPMMITEFGCMKRSGRGFSADCPPYYGYTGDPLECAPGDDPSDQTNSNYVARAQWHYDTRTLMESYNLGWTAYETRSGMGVFAGVPWSGAIHNYSPMTSMVTNMHQALFGATRPSL